MIIVRRIKFSLDGHGETLRLLLQGSASVGVGRKQLIMMLRSLSMIVTEPTSNGMIGKNGNKMTLRFNGEMTKIQIPETDPVVGPTFEDIRNLILKSGVRRPKDVWKYVK